MIFPYDHGWAPYLRGICGGPFLHAGAATAAAAADVGCQDAQRRTRLWLSSSASPSHHRLTLQTVRDLRLGKNGGRWLLGESGHSHRVAKVFGDIEGSTAKLCFSSNPLGTKTNIGILFILLVSFCLFVCLFVYFDAWSGFMRVSKTFCDLHSHPMVFEDRNRSLCFVLNTAELCGGRHDTARKWIAGLPSR